MTSLLNYSEDEILDKLWAIETFELPSIENEVIQLLDRRSILVRLEAVRALWKIGPGTADILRVKALEERNGRNRSPAR